MDFGYLFVLEAIGIQLIWAIAVMIVRKFVFDKVGEEDE